MGKSIKASPDLVVSIDLGASLTKIVAVDKLGKYILLAPGADVSQVPVEMIEMSQSKIWGDGLPEHQMWASTSEGSFACGTFALENFKGRSNLVLSKLDECVPKILTAIWVLAQKYQLGDRFTVRLGCLLPAAECSEGDINELRQRLIPALKSFVTPTGKMRVKIAGDIEVKPEGAGIYIYHRTFMGQKHLRSIKLGILGIGYRNANLLISTNGAVSDRHRYTNDLGFHYLVSEVKRLQGSAFDVPTLASLIHDIGWKVNSVLLPRRLEELNKLRRLDSLTESIEKAKEIYWMQFNRWLKDLRFSSRSVDAIGFYGGSIVYFSEPLFDYFKSCPNIYWPKTIEVAPSLIKEIVVEKSQKGLSYRFADPWCFCHLLCQQTPGYKELGLAKLLEEKNNDQRK